MHIIDPEACQSCGACAGSCPVGAISIPSGKNYFVISDDCTDCGACEADCGFDAISAE